MKFFAGLCVGGLVAAGSLGQVTPTKGGYLLRTKYLNGQSLKYKMKTATKFSGSPMVFEAPMSITVTNVSNGVSDLSTTFGPATMQGQQIPETKAMMKVDDRGRAVAGGANGLSATFPEKPVKIGETWTGAFDMAKAGAMGEARATYTFKGLKGQGKKQVAEIGVVIDTKGATKQAGSMNSKGNGTMLLNATDGQLLSLTMTMTISMGGTNGQKPMVLPMEMSLKRQ